MTPSRRARPMHPSAGRQQYCRADMQGKGHSNPGRGGQTSPVPRRAERYATMAAERRRPPDALPFPLDYQGRKRVPARRRAVARGFPQGQGAAAVAAGRGGWPYCNSAFGRRRSRTSRAPSFRRTCTANPGTCTSAPSSGSSSASSITRPAIVGAPSVGSCQS